MSMSKISLLHFFSLLWASTKKKKKQHKAGKDTFLLQWYGQDSPELFFPFLTCLLEQIN